MGKLYELLAVEQDLRKQSAGAVGKLRDLFTKGQGRFVGAIRTYHKVTDDETIPEIPREEVVRATSVFTELGMLQYIFGSYLDANISKELTNTLTKAEFEIDGKTYELPATALLAIEGKLEELHGLYALIPVLDPAEKWEYDHQQNCYVAKTRTAQRTAKIDVPVVLYEHTKEHPAQVELRTKDVVTHTVELVQFSGAISQAEKDAVLLRIEELHRIIKQARQRANDVTVEEQKLSSVLFDYIHKPILHE